MKFIKKNKGKTSGKETIYIVSGLPRSGTSMMMQILEAGGMAVVTDKIRQADPDNPRGYYEFEKAKSIEKDTSWLDECKGKALKMISALVAHLPLDRKYKIIFMERDLKEVVKSQKIMLERADRAGSTLSDDELIKKFEIHLDDTKKWLACRNNIEVIYINYNRMIEYPDKCLEKIDDFLEIKLNMQEMKKAVDKKLYRNAVKKPG